MADQTYYSPQTYSLLKLLGLPATRGEVQEKLEAYNKELLSAFQKVKDDMGGGGDAVTESVSETDVTEGTTRNIYTFGFRHLLSNGMVLTEGVGSGAGESLLVIASSVTDVSAITNDNPGMFSAPPSFSTSGIYKSISLPVAGATASQVANLSWTWNGLPFSLKVTSQSAG